MTTQSNGHPIGALVRVDCPDSFAHGYVCRVTSSPSQWIEFPCIPSSVFIGQEVDIFYEERGDFLAFEPHELIPIYDGHEPVAWDESIWHPQKVTA